MTQPWELGVTGSDQTRMVERAEKLGYDMVAIPEHIIMPREHVELSGPHWMHSTTTQANFASTKSIRLNSCITILPLQHLIITAKALATADWLSGGRITVSFGVGWLQQEFELLGVPFEPEPYQLAHFPGRCQDPRAVRAPARRCDGLSKSVGARENR